MSENRKLVYWIASILGCTFLLVLGVAAHDRQIDKCIVDHLFDFHLDTDHVIENIEQERLVREDSERRQREWVRDIRDRWRDSETSFSGNDRGTSGPPDRDK